MDRITEEDTFNRLRRECPKVTVSRYNEWFDSYYYEWSEAAADEFLKPFGWTFNELGQAYINLVI